MGSTLETRIAKLESAARRTGAATEEKSYLIWDALWAQEGGVAAVRQFARAAKAKDLQSAFGKLLADDSTADRVVRAVHTAQKQKVEIEKGGTSRGE